MRRSSVCTQWLRARPLLPEELEMKPGSQPYQKQTNSQKELAQGLFLVSSGSWHWRLWSQRDTIERPMFPIHLVVAFSKWHSKFITGTFGDMGSWSCVFVLPYRTKLPKPWGAVRSGSSARLFYFACVCVCVCCCVWKRLRPLQTVHIGRAEIFAVIIISSTSFISSPGNFWFRPSFNQNIRYFNSFANNPCPKGECHLFDFAWRECDTGIMSSFACKAEIPL